MGESGRDRIAGLSKEGGAARRQSLAMPHWHAGAARPGRSRRGSQRRRRRRRGGIRSWRRGGWCGRSKRRRTDVWCVRGRHDFEPNRRCEGRGGEKSHRASRAAIPTPRGRARWCDGGGGSRRRRRRRRRRCRRCSASASASVKGDIHDWTGRSATVPHPSIHPACRRRIAASDTVVVLASNQVRPIVHSRASHGGSHWNRCASSCRRRERLRRPSDAARTGRG